MNTYYIYSPENRSDPLVAVARKNACDRYFNAW